MGMTTPEVPSRAFSGIKRLLHKEQKSLYPAKRLPEHLGRDHPQHFAYILCLSMRKQLLYIQVHMEWVFKSLQLLIAVESDHSLRNLKDSLTLVR